MILKDKFPVIKLMTKGDFFLIAGIIILVGILFLKPLFSDGNLYGEVYYDSQKVHEVDFSSVAESYVITAGGCEILVENDGLSFKSSLCPDKLCINSGKLSLAGDTMACVPEKVVVVIKSDKKVHDAVSY